MSKRFAIIENGVVVNTALADGPLSGAWIESTVAGIGWTYEGGEFTSPPALPTPSAPAVIRHLSKLGFRNRFTPTEKATIEFAALDNPSAGLPARMQAAGIRASLADQRDATYIDPMRTDTRQGVIDMEAAGLLTAGRALQILDAPILDDEMFKG